MLRDRADRGCFGGRGGNGRQSWPFKGRNAVLKKCPVLACAGTLGPSGSTVRRSGARTVSAASMCLSGHGDYLRSQICGVAFLSS